MEPDREAPLHYFPRSSELVEIRLRLLRIAADLAPRISMGTKAEDVVARARVLELYVASPSPGSTQVSGPADPERGAPEPAANPDDPPGADAGAAGSEADRQDS